MDVWELKKENLAYESINDITTSYYQQLENYGVYHPFSEPLATTPQPQVHVGLIATPQLNPSSEATTFLNFAVYWFVECSLEVNFNDTSRLTKGNAAAYPSKVLFYPNKEKKYTSGATLLGVNDTDSGDGEKQLTLS